MQVGKPVLNAVSSYADTQVKKRSCIYRNTVKNIRIQQPANNNVRMCFCTIAHK